MSDDGRPAAGGPAAAADALCRRIAEEFHGCMFFAGMVIFHRERWYQRLLHNETAYLIQ